MEGGMKMDFALTKEQKDVVKAAREFAQGEFPEHAQKFDREETFDFDLWKKGCELGFVGMYIKEAYGVWNGPSFMLSRDGILGG
jgi:alkylation response protein AidB-like acyl-CoA dehydrogenase